MLMKAHLERQSRGASKYLDDFTVQQSWLEKMASWTGLEENEPCKDDDEDGRI